MAIHLYEYPENHGVAVLFIQQIHPMFSRLCFNNADKGRTSAPQVFTGWV